MKSVKSKSAYLFYCQENRERVRGELGDGVSQPDIIRALAAEWRGLTDEDKEPFQKMADDDKKK